MFCMGYDSYKSNVDGTKEAVVHLVCATEPGTMPMNGEGMEGDFPTESGDATTFAPGSDCVITGSAKVKMLNDEYGWDDL